LDRCALFVDAGYVLAEGALAVHGTRNRDSVSWDYAGLLKLLGGLSRDRTGLPLLRCYWYDTASDGGRATEHDTLADVPGLKLRLSKLRPNRKEGVEAEIRKDLSALARNRGVSDAVIVSAEEDLGPVIAEIQDLGIRVVLLHVSADGNWAVSRSLRQECDDIIDMSAGHLRPYVDLIAGAEPAGREAQLAPAGYRELPVGAAASGGQLAGVTQQPAIAAPAPQLYSSPVAPEYERVSPAQLAASTRDQQASLQPQDAGRYAGTGAAGSAGPPEGVGAAPGGHRRPEDQSQLMAQYQSQDSGRGLAAAGLPPGQPGYGQNAFADPGQGGNGQARPGNGTVGQSGFGPAASPQHGGSGPHGLLPAAAPQQNGLPQRGLQQNGLSQNGLPQNGLQQNAQPNGLPAAASQQNGLSHGGYGQSGGQQANGQIGGANQPGGPQSGMQLEAGLQPGQPGPQGTPNGALGHGQQGQGMPSSAGLPSGPGMPPGVSSQGVQPSQGLPGQAVGQHGLGGQAMPPGSPMPTGQHHGASGQGMQSLGVPAGPPQGHRHSAAAPGLMPGGPNGGSGLSQGPGGQQSALAPLDPQRGLPPARQLPAANGVPYPPSDRNGLYGGQPGQFAAPPPGQGYTQPPYSGPQQSMQMPQPPPPVAMSVGEAVQSAHAEGFGFGEAVARDAPALWLEAVLARKPRMPSDLEARLLQGSALPIDSLLHDEVRHALRRGFWDALERSRH
jgi:hypothetical protein